MYQKISLFLALLVLVSPFTVSTGVAYDYIHPPFVDYINAPLPKITSSEQVVGIYGNILYPQDEEQVQQSRLNEWIEAYAKDSKPPFPLSAEDLNAISLYNLEKFPLRALLRYHHFLEMNSKEAREQTELRAELYKEIARSVPPWKGRCELLVAKLLECANYKVKCLRTEERDPFRLIAPPYTWDMRLQVLQQMVDKVTSLSPNCPYFLALQEVTPQALSDLKKRFAERNLQWISFNNMSGKTTLEPKQEEVFGEATGFTATMALSPDLKVLKVAIGDLPTESGSARKILGVRVLNTHTNAVFNLFTMHTDHKIQNDIYARTAVKVHAFVTQFFADIPPNEQRFVLGGDLNAFVDLGGDKYLETLRKLFLGSQDFRQTHYYAPQEIAWSTFIGRSEDAYSLPVASDGTVQPNALDHILVGNGIELKSAAREALVYSDSGELLDYYKDKDAYKKQLQKKTTFSDHFFNIVRFN